MKRHHIVTVIILSLLAPHLATALPRPEEAVCPEDPERKCVNQTEPQQQVGPTIFLQANDSTGQATPLLQQDRTYFLEVSGIWRPSGDANNKADAVCETTNNSNWNKTGKGLVIFATNYGSPSNSEPCRFDHSYRLKFIGRGVSELVRINDDGIYSDNSGSLTIKVMAQNKVAYTGALSRPINLVRPATPEIGRIDFQPVHDNTMVTQSVTATVPGVEYPVPVPEVFHLRFQFDAGDSGCPGGKYFHMSGHVAGTPFDTANVQRVCVPAPSAVQSVYNQLEQRPITAGGNQGPLVSPTPIGTTVTTASGNTCRTVTSTTSSTLNAIGGETGQCHIVLQKERQEETLIPLIPPGSSVNLLFSWSADTSKLWKTAVNDRNPQTGEESNAVWAPFSPGDANWFNSEVQAGRLALKVGLLILTPTGPIGLPQIASIPGFGQFMEAAFHTKVNCSPESPELC